MPRRKRRTASKQCHNDFKLYNLKLIGQNFFIDNFDKNKKLLKLNVHNITSFCVGKHIKLYKFKKSKMKSCKPTAKDFSSATKIWKYLHVKKIIYLQYQHNITLVKTIQTFNTLWTRFCPQDYEQSGPQIFNHTNSRPISQFLCIE